MDSFQLPNAEAGQPYGATLYAVGGKPPYQWSLDPEYSTDFALTGLWLDPSKGLIRGTISDSMAGKTIRFAVIVKDSTGQTALGKPIYEIHVEP